MAAPCDLNVAKKNLSEALGENMKLYLHNLKAWFRQKTTKEEFDSEARKLLKTDTVHLHNEFLLAIISKCQTLGSTLVPSSSGPSKLVKKGKVKKKPLSSRSSLQPLILYRNPFYGFQRGSCITQHRFSPVNPLTYALPVSGYKGVDDAVFSSRELTLPDVAMVHGRMIVCAWEFGLRDVSDNSVKLIMQSVEQQLKSVISHVLSRRNGYKVREKRFRFAVGTDVHNPYKRHTYLHQMETESEPTIISASGNHIPSYKLPVDYGEGYAAQCLEHPVYTTDEEKEPVDLFHLLEALQLNKNSVPSHTVYAPAIERIIHKLWHPSNEELEQEVTYEQEVGAKQQHHTPVR